MWRKRKELNNTDEYNIGGNDDGDDDDDDDDGNNNANDIKITLMEVVVLKTFHDNGYILMSYS